MGRIIGIDLGTTNSVAAYWRRRRPKTIFNTRYQSPLTPSIVALDRGERIVGQDAKDRRASGSRDVIYSIKRLIGRDYDHPDTQRALSGMGYLTRKADNGEVEVKLGERYYSPVEISGMILSQLKKDAEHEFGEDVSHAVITVPAYFGQRQKNATREAGILAGFHVLRVINEPTAAALAFGVDEGIPEPQHILVFDLGGGTFDVSILMVAEGNFEVLTIDGDNFLGGDDMDELIVEVLFDHVAGNLESDLSEDPILRIKLKSLAEEAKISLSRESEVRIVKPSIITGVHGEHVNLDYLLTREDFQELISEIVDRAIEITLRAIEKAYLKPEDINRVLLVGGGTRVPLVRKRLKDLFGERIEIDVDPMYCVALGAAVQTAIPVEWMCAHCNSVNAGMQETCKNCDQAHEEDETSPMIRCESCGTNNRQGKNFCWNCKTAIGAMVELIEDDLGGEGAAHQVHVGDITAKYLGVEVLHHAAHDEYSKLEIIVPKGTPFPTLEPYRQEMYTNRTNQEAILIPLYEVDEESAGRLNWEHVGEIVNNLIPPGTPAETPVIIEVHIDQDGILTVNSYLKHLRDETLMKKSFTFGGEHKVTEELPEIFQTISFQAFYLNTVKNFHELSKYVNEEGRMLAGGYAARAESVLDTRDESSAEALAEEITDFTSQLPGQVFVLFGAYWLIENEYIEPVQKNRLQQMIMQMDSYLINGQNDQANQILDQIRLFSDELFKQIPSNLLKTMRN